MCWFREQNENEVEVQFHGKPGKLPILTKMKRPRNADALRRQFRQPGFLVLERDEIIGVRDLSLTQFPFQACSHFDMAFTKDT